jgi:hypothetical protein
LRPEYLSQKVDRPLPTCAFLAVLLLVLIDGWPAEAQTLILPQRNRTTDWVVFYAAPNGNDVNNNCLDVALPCTPEGAGVQSKVNWDFMQPIGGCFIKLARGHYTVPSGGVLMRLIGPWVGHYGCQVSGDVDPPPLGHCIDPNTVVIDVPNGGIGFYNKDGVISVISCLTLTGSNNAVGIWSQQSLVIDIADVVCGPIPRCIDAETTPAVNINGPMWLGGDMTTLFAAGSGTQIKVWYQPITPLRQLTVGHWALAYGAGASVEFLGSRIPNSGLISGPTQCIAAWTGIIMAGGTPLPCAITLAQDGKFYP